MTAIDHEPDYAAIREKLLSLMHALLRNATTAAPMEIHNADYGEKVAFGVWYRCLSLYRGIVTLVQENAPTEALILLRPLLQESIWLRYAAANLDKLQELAISRGFQSLRKDRGLLENERNMLNADTTWPRSGMEQEKAQLDQEAADLQVLLREAGLTQVPQHIDELAMAKALGYDTYGWTTAYSSQFVHGNTRALLHLATSEADGTVALGSRDRALPAIRVGITATGAFISATQAAATVLNWTTHAELVTFGNITYEEMKSVLRAAEIPVGPETPYE